MLWSTRSWWSESSAALAPTAVGLSFPGIEDSPTAPPPTPPSQDPKRPNLCSPVPRLLAFLPRPLSNSPREADGPGFLCTNQGGICSLADTSPLTHVSGRIHYSSWVRWAAIRLHNKAENRQRWRGGWECRAENYFLCLVASATVRKVKVTLNLQFTCQSTSWQRCIDLMVCRKQDRTRLVHFHEVNWLIKLFPFLLLFRYENIRNLWHFVTSALSTWFVSWRQTRSSFKWIIHIDAGGSQPQLLQN